MSLTTKLSDKLERELREFCKANKLQLGEYLAKCIEKQFNLDRYGDLNEILAPKKKVSIPIEVKNEPLSEPVEIKNETPPKPTVNVSMENGMEFAGENIEKAPKRVRVIESR